MDKLTLTGGEGTSSEEGEKQIISKRRLSYQGLAKLYRGAGEGKPKTYKARDSRKAIFY